MNNEKIIWDQLYTQIKNKYGVAGLMGNLKAESGLNPKNLQNSFEKKLGMNDDEYTAAVDNGTYKNFIKDGAGYGLAQWTFWSLKQELYNYSKSVNKSIGDLNMQIAVLLKQLQTKYPNTWKILQNATTVKQASNEVLFKFERPRNQGIKVQQTRLKYAQEIYNRQCGAAITNSIKMPKYTESNQPVQCFMKNSTCYKNTTTMNIVGVLWHSTGANNPNIRRYVQPDDQNDNKAYILSLLGQNTNNNDYNHTNVRKGLNAFIGRTALGNITTIQTMPWNYKPWGCNSGPNGSLNNTHIQFECCEDNLSDEKYFNEIFEEGCQLTAYLCWKYNINPNGKVNINGILVPTILCHKDANNLGLASNHADVLHWFKLYNKTMDDVRRRVAEIMLGYGNAKPTTATYKAKVIAKTNLNCRSGAGILFSRVGVYKPGSIITILKEKNGWGRTNSGWVNLQYIQKEN